MSDAVSALGNVSYQDGIARISEVGPVGMITVRGDLTAAKVKRAVRSIADLEMPGQGKVAASTTHAICWMSPDEVLVQCPYADVSLNLAALQKALGETHSLVVDVSDARAVFQVSGPHAREVMAKLAPVDFAPGAFEPGMFRRSRLAQVAAAFWMRDSETFEIVCFRSVAQYVFDLLKVAATPGSDVGVFTKT